MEKTIAGDPTKDRAEEHWMRNIIGGLIVVAALAAGQDGAVEFRHLYTFGSKQGIHPRTVLNRRPATAALGRPDNPYGLVFPVGVAADLHGRVWITDSGTASVHAIRRRDRRLPRDSQSGRCDASSTFRSRGRWPGAHLPERLGLRSGLHVRREGRV